MRLSMARGGMIVRKSLGVALLTIFNLLPVSGAVVERHATADGTVAISIAEVYHSAFSSVHRALFCPLRLRAMCRYETSIVI
jgi:hypothetical protein